MSTGEQQRVAIAIALANDPQVLLADEPTGSLDDENAARMLALLNTVRKELGVTVVIVTHDTNVARTLDRYVAIRDGKTVTEEVRLSDSRELIPKIEEEGEEWDADTAVKANAGLTDKDAPSHEHFVLLDFGRPDAGARGSVRPVWHQPTGAPGGARRPPGDRSSE